MRKLLLKTIALAMVNAVIGLAVLAGVDFRHAYRPWETDSLLEVIPRNEFFDLVILGSSRAYTLSRFRDNHRALERTLGMRVLNLALPTGGGPRPARLFFEHFLARGNQTKVVVYFVAPFVFFDDGPNDEHKFVYYEPLRPSFLFRLFTDGYPWRRIFIYIRSKFSWDALTQQPEPLIRQTFALRGIDPERVKMRMETLYPKGLREDLFERYAPELRRILEDCRNHGCRVHLVIAPTLLGPEPGATRIAAYIASVQAEFGCTFDDFSQAMPDPAFFYNLDHMNTAGVEQFVQKLLKSVLNEECVDLGGRRPPQRPGAT